jgi:serine/threonine protein phosphatase PrpC/CRP-like cAMP-binding protein
MILSEAASALGHREWEGVGLKLVCWGATDVGNARRVNEDSFLLVPEHGFVAVADGMGGYQRGDVAAQLACNVIKETITGHRQVIDLYRRNPNEATQSAVQTMMDSAMQKACREVHDAAVAITGKGGRMGTTMDLLLQVGRTAFIGPVGDGRIFLMRGGEVHQLTKDHSLDHSHLDASSDDTGRNVITRALGVFPSVLVDFLAFDLDVGDRLVLCSDGLYRYLDADELKEEVSEGTVAKVVDRLVGMANTRGGRDNITVVVCAVESETRGETEQATLRRMEVLRNVGLFQYCTYRELMRVCQTAEVREVKKGTVLFDEGDLGRECYIIERGRVVIRKKDVELATLTTSDYFGEMSFIDVPRRSATAVATMDTRLLIIRRNQFLQLLKQDSELAAKLMWQLLQKLSRLVRTTNRRLVAQELMTEPPAPETPLSGIAGDTILEEDD